MPIRQSSIVRSTGSSTCAGLLLAACLLCSLNPTNASAQTQASAPAQAAPASPGAVFPADKLAALLPPSVYFQGKTAPLQTRNAGGTTFAGGAIVWVALVDASGYATNVQERYQFYLVSEGPLNVGDARIAAGAYGGGFVGDHFIIMDLGGHTIAQGPVQTDAALTRPRPLQIVPDTLSSVKLYLGRRWVELQPGTSSASGQGTK
jgi:hypothetical protein